MADKPETGVAQKKPTKKICCACPETKKARDECIALHGPDSQECKQLIEAHKECLRSEGFQID